MSRMSISSTLEGTKSGSRVEQMGEKQELLATMMDRKKILQKEAPEEFHKQIDLSGNQGVGGTLVQRRNGITGKET